MTSPWVVTTSTERVDLDTQRQGELTFTVTNAGDAADQVVFEPVPGEGVERSALTVDNPARQVPGHGSASFLVRIAIPQQAVAGRYEMYGQAYSAHLAPEETLGRSGRVVFEVAPAPQPRKRPWWLLAVAALVVIVLAVVLWLVFSRNTAPPPRPTPSARPTAVAVPNLAGLSEAVATDTLTKAGLKVGTVRHRFDPANVGKVDQQGTEPGKVLALGIPVDLGVGIPLSAPQPLAPPPGSTIPAAGAVEFRWSAVPNVTTYRLVVARQWCSVVIFPGQSCGSGQVTDQKVTATSVVVTMPPPPPGAVPLGTTETITWQIFAIDDFGNLGPVANAQFVMHV